MHGSSAATVAQFLAEFDAPDRKVLAAVRKLVRQHLPKGYREAMACGMIAWIIPLSRYPDTYNGQPLMYAALAREKRYFSLHLMCAYGSKAVLQRLQAGYAKAGKKLNMGKACIRFRALDDLAPAAIGEAIAAVPVDGFIAVAEAARRPRR